MTGLATRLVLGVTSIGLVSELISRGKARLQVVATCHEHPSRNSHFETRMNMPASLVDLPLVVNTPSASFQFLNEAVQEPLFE